ncbi:Putative exported protein (modular protein) [Sterolibacterium denitrificans]|uniref:Exported protein (Modular protein) n=1 Tax=Sterolibacterium denitrificans TaxID=157592 RepID=A0A7Z7HS07_9PROT|nr:lipoprotein [Sterolibacterium denitrificans]SMB26456.1 Putative exported protein (modular protein) [Sterolibacterium denitrificans]
MLGFGAFPFIHSGRSVTLMRPPLQRHYLIYPVFIMLAACGTKTPLTLPPGHGKPPLFGVSGGTAPETATAAPTSQPQADDHNKPVTDTKTKTEVDTETP